MKIILSLLIVLSSVLVTSVSAQEDYYGSRSRNSIEYKACPTNGDYLIKIDRKHYYSDSYGIVDLNKKEIFPAAFKNVYVFANGAFLLYDGYKTIHVDKDFSILKSYDGYIGENNTYFVAIGKRNTQFPLEVFDLNGNSLLAKLNLDMSVGYYVTPLVKNEEANNGLYVVTKDERSGRQTAALFDVPNFRWVTDFDTYEFIPYGAGVLAIKDRIKNPRRDYYSRYGYGDYYEGDFEDSKLPDSKFDADYYENGKKVKSFNDAYLMYKNTLVYKNESGKYGIVDKNLKTIVPFEYDLTGDYTPNSYLKFAVLSKGGQNFLFDEKGTQILKQGYQKITPLGRNVFQVQKNNKYGVITSDEKEIIAVKYDSLNYSYRYILGKVGSTWEVLKIKNEGELTVAQSGLSSVQILANGDLALEKDKKWALMSGDGNTSAFAYEEIQLCGERYVYKTDNKYGFLSDEGKPLSKATFDAILYETDNLYIIRAKGKYGVIELESDTEKIKINEKIAAKYDFITRDRSYYYGDYSFIVLDRSSGKSEIKEVSSGNRY
jgi:hypothetical protein